ncbi:riboflavin kinase / FMN adenylyltransferase [Sanguibacter gelidistatuariae]|uniref:Riboflavin biosynthesis protein n=1 Tax=Sanguibacter gelidistatuariae TaxID=1814289 RepID=A0A1G6NMQ4_9MICO|nr:bifunctional riboflavin kinase/FAD synthetase [Sanguibacter gelidistatuariae]SDC69173.1 riboflavin kinase / FMN adenylyltransferase [Sanguibacter gelidistatuariae]
MQRWNGLSQVPAGVGPSVVTIGNFDGVHRGHAKVITRLIERARELSARSVAITFDPHPAQVHRPAEAPPLICGLTDRLDLLEATGLDAVLVLPYSLDFAQLTPRDFVAEYIVGALGACTVAVGRDVRFGLNNSGTLTTMIELGQELGFTVEVIDDVGNDAAARWSSSAVRELLLAGRVTEAARVLGRPHRLRGVVVHGDARGRELGFPTANLSQDAEGMVPADGVYAGWVRRPSSTEDAVLPAAISIGTNPTFDGVQRRVEAYVLDRTDLDLYGEEILVEFVEHLRPTLRFDGLEPLVIQMHDDVVQAREILAGGPADR